MAYNKIIYGGTTLIDLTADTVDAAHLISGYTAHNKAGEVITGSNTSDSDTSDATAVAADILSGETAYAKGSKVTGTMVNNGAVTGNISTVSGTYTVPVGYHNGSGTVAISAVEQAKIIASNIKEGVTILGVTGTYTTGYTYQEKTVTPSTSAQTIVADTGYDALSKVTVNAIPYSEEDNSAGGVTVTIAGD